MSSEPAWSEPELPAPPPPRERHLGLFSAATPSGQVAEAPRRVHWACWSGLQRLRSSAPRWRPRWPPPQIVLRSCDFFVSQRRLAPPGRVRGPRAAQEGSGALGDVLLRSSYSLEASGTRCARRARWTHRRLGAAASTRITLRVAAAGGTRCRRATGSRRRRRRRRRRRGSRPDGEHRARGTGRRGPPMACYSDSVFRASGGPTLAAAASHSSRKRAMALRSAWFGTTSVDSSR